MPPIRSRDSKPAACQLDGARAPLSRPLAQPGWMNTLAGRQRFQSMSMREQREVYLAMIHGEQSTEPSEQEQAAVGDHVEVEDDGSDRKIVLGGDGDSEDHKSEDKGNDEPQLPEDPARDTQTVAKKQKNVWKPKPEKCSKCDEMIASHIHRHMRRHCKTLTAEDKQWGRAPCPVPGCSTTLSRLDARLRHVRDTHGLIMGEGETTRAFLMRAGSL